MKKSHLLGAVAALPFLAMIITASADLLTSDDPSIILTGQSNVQSIAALPPLFPGAQPTVDVPDDPGQKQVHESFNFFTDGKSAEPERPHSDSHASFWLLLLALVVAGTLSEILFRRSFKR